MASTARHTLRTTREDATSAWLLAYQGLLGSVLVHRGGQAGIEPGDQVTIVASDGVRLPAEVIDGGDFYYALCVLAGGAR